MTTPAPAPLAIGESRDFVAGRVVISVTRTALATYRVVVLETSGLALDCFTTEFTPERIPADMSVRAAAWEYIQCLVRDFGADLETPAAVTQRVRALAA